MSAMGILRQLTVATRLAYTSPVEEKSMNYVRAILSGLAAIVLAWVVILAPELFRGLSEQKATGLGVLVAIILSPVFWILALLFTALFFAASQIVNTLLKTFLFWIPTLLLSTLGVAIFAFFTYMFIRLKHL